MHPTAQQAIESLLQHGYQCNITAPYKDGLEGFTRDLKELFSKYLDPSYVEAELVLPPDLQAFLQVIQGSYHKRNWAVLYGMEGIVASTQYDLELWKPEPEDAVMWISIGGWSDKHQLLMCLNTTSTYFGKVIDAYDDHPYCSATFEPDHQWDGLFSYTTHPE